MTRRFESFCRQDYAQLLRDLMDRGYSFGALEDLKGVGPVAFCRHDVDLSMSHAADMAELEHSLGVRATYYVLLSTRMYGLASAEGRAFLERLIQLGHEVGLHFDATQYAGDRDSLEIAARDECAILEMLTRQPVTSLSFHRPAPALLGLEGGFAGRVHTYEPRFFNATAYVSDSNGGWHHGHPLDHAAVAAGEPLQLLTHPIWWMQDQPANAVAVLERLRRRIEATVQSDLVGTVKQYAQWSGQVAGS